MFPFKVRFSKTLKEQINPERFPDFLIVSRNMLSEAGADYFSRENNRLNFDNKLFKLTSNWNLMASVDAGFVEIKLDRNNHTKITYSITLITPWVISIIFVFIIWLSANEIIWAFWALFGAGIVLGLIIGLIRHMVFFYTMVDNMIDKK